MTNEILDQEDARSWMNQMGSLGIPFLFYTNWKGTQTKIFPLDKTEGIQYSFQGLSNSALSEDTGFDTHRFKMESEPIPYNIFSNAFNVIQSYLSQGDSYLINLTYPNQIYCNYRLADLYQMSHALYKLHVPDQFLVFSPEAFIKIKDGVISTYPMKGTIQAHIPNAKETLLNDLKESAEHSTIVDLMRNDLSIVSKNVRVKRYKYLELINAFPNQLYQMSSEITGELPNNYLSTLGDILYNLLPAGSISGAPKKKTVEIIENVEVDNRSWYTGVCGIFDGVSLDTAVMIRYIEKEKNGLIFRSGGGITAQSDLAKEYQELINKIYVPISGNHTNQERNNYKFNWAQQSH